MSTPPEAFERGPLLYQGKAKQVYATHDPARIIIHYTDGATAFNGVKKADIADKGVINCRISAFFMEKVAGAGVPVAFERNLDDRDQLCLKVEIIPVEVVVLPPIYANPATSGLKATVNEKGPNEFTFEVTGPRNDP